jgi:O-methyltransferase
MYFKDRPFYLFDTFCGFDSRDTDNENSSIAQNWLHDYGHLFDGGNEQIALARCPFPENVLIRKGYIPETFTGLENEKFAFVSLDMDLYLPTLNALRFFVPRLTHGGVIQVHDYFHPDLPGVKQAVDELSQEYSFLRIPTGDTVTIALAGFEKR